MKEEIYKKIIKNSKIPYLKINCKKDDNNKFIAIEVIDQSKEAERFFNLLTENNILNKEITDILINNWINKNFKNYEFNNFVEKVIKTGYERLKYITKSTQKHIIIDVYYLNDYFLLIYNIDDKGHEKDILKSYSWSKDLNGIYLDMTGTNTEKIKIAKSIIGKKDEDIWDEDGIKQFRQHESQVIKDRDVKTFFEVLTNKNGKKLYLESTIWPRIDENDNITGLSGYSVEINDKLIFEKNMEQNEENFKEITKYSDSVFIIRDKYRATYVSPSYKQVFEAKEEELYKDINKLEVYFKRVSSNDKYINYNYDYNYPDEGTGKVRLDNGKEKWIWYKYLPIRDQMGNVTKRIGILTDITVKKKIEEEKMQFKLDFFANLSHELRTPINLISSTIQLIKLKLNKLSPEDSRNFDKYIKIMEINSFRLVRLINNLLDSTKIDAGFTSFTPVSADIINFVEGVCDSFTEYAKFNKVNLIFDTNEEEEVVLFDPDIIERILLNLLSNAVKFNKVGGNIYVNVDIKKEKIIISVEDEGMGIAEDKIDYIFKRFEQVQNNKKIERQGSGIGLYLVKSLIDLHGGTVEVKSKVDKGSKFTVSIPKKEAKDSEQTIIYDDNRYKRGKVEFSDI